MADLDLLAADARMNPGKEYSVWFRCGTTSGYFGGHYSRPYFEMQVGHYNNIKSPYYSYSDATLHNIPAEEGFRAFPEAPNCSRFNTPGCIDQRVSHALTYVPWLFNGNFEDFGGSTAGWSTFDAVQSVKCDATPAQQGRCYNYWRPQPQGFNHGWIYSRSGISSFYIRDGESGWKQGWLGNNTGIQVEGSFRCPRWAPEWAGRTDDRCTVEVYVRTPTGHWERRGFRMPADGVWRHAIAEFGAQPTGQRIEFWIDNDGFPIDVDALWVHSGL